MDKLYMKITATAITILLIAVGAVAYMAVSGNFFATGTDATQTDNSDTTAGSAEQTTADSGIAVVAPLENIPERIRGAWMCEGTDLVTKFKPLGNIKTEIDAAIFDIKDMGYNSVFLDIARGERTFDDEVCDLLSYALDKAEEYGLYTVVKCNAFTSSNGIQSVTEYESDMQNLCKGYRFDAILMTDPISELTNLSGATEQTVTVLNSYLTDAEEYLLREAGGAELIIQTSFERLGTFDAAPEGESDALEQAETPSVVSAFEATGRTADEAYLDMLVSHMKSGKLYGLYAELSSAVSEGGETPFAEEIEDICKNLASFGGSLVCGGRSDLGGAQENDAVIQLLRQFSAYDFPEDKPDTAVRSYAFLKQDRGSATRYFYKYMAGNFNADAALRSFEINNYSSKTIRTNESTVTFRGGFSPLFELKCNGKIIKCNDSGDFSVEYDLTVGGNDFVFEYKGETYKYVVTYEMDIISNVLPQGEIKTDGNTVIEISALVLDGAEVRASLNGANVKLTRGNITGGDDGDNSDKGSDFVSYIGQYTLPNSSYIERDLGTITVTASYNGVTETEEGADVIVNAKPKEPKPPESETTTASGGTEKETTTSPFTNKDEESSDFGKLLTPYSYAGVSGTAKMCEVNIDYCETLPMSPMNNTSVPIATPLLKGTFDYVVGESSYGEYKYYNLASGYRIYRDEADLISDAYKLPDNKLKVMSSSSAGTTSIKLATLWKAPFIAKAVGQTYITDSSNGRKWAVSSFTATGIDFIFYHTSSASGSVNCSGSTVAKSAEWITDSAEGTTTLRINFKNPGEFYGYHIAYNSDGNLVLKINGRPSLSGAVIMLDPGHGGDDAGASCAAYHKTLNTEAKINLAIALKVKAMLEAKGATVLMTRTGNDSVSLAERKELIRGKNPNLFISIHCDSWTDSDTNGISSFYYTAWSQPIAKDIYLSLLSATGAKGRKVALYPFSVTRIEECPSVLVECGFVSNIDECARLQNESYRDKIAQGITAGVEKFYS